MARCGKERSWTHLLCISECTWTQPNKDCTLPKWASWHKVHIVFCKANSSPSFEDVKVVVARECKEYQSIDPTPICCLWGKLSKAWKWLGMNIIHCNGRHYLTLINCGPSQFTIWRPLQQQNSTAIITHVEALFYDQNPPEELFTDNDTMVP